MGDFRTFCAIFYLLTRQFVNTIREFMKSEKKVIVMPRFIIVAAVAMKIIPTQMAYDFKLTPTELKYINELKPMQKAKAQPKKGKKGKQVPAADKDGRYF